MSGAAAEEPRQPGVQTALPHLGERIPIVGVGGIFTADDAYERIRSGATLVQVYTALIYEGPEVIQRDLTGLTARMTATGSPASRRR